MKEVIDTVSLESADVTHWNSFRIGSFADNFTFKLPSGNSFWLGVGLRGNKTDHNRVRLDFNPNKVGSENVLLQISRCIAYGSKEMHHRITRFDLAIDIPVERDMCFLVKDNRAYIERRHGKELTQYLGARSSNVGRVKLYNKQIEAKLDYPLTRLELTLSPMKHEEINFPKVYYIKSQQIQFDELSITDTERFILGAILQGYGSTKDLGRKTRAKIENLLENYVEYVELPENIYSKLLERLEHFRVYGTLD